jgi:hypothetical protein
MTLNQFMLSFFWGMIGVGFFMYGKRAGRLVPLLVGVGLMIIPYFIASLIYMSLACIALCALPWVFRDA